jgi:hypothetical protein
MQPVAGYVNSKRKEKMIDRSMIHDEECICATDYLEAPIKCCLELNQTKSKTLNYFVVPDTTRGLSTDDVGVKNVRIMSSILKEFISTVLDILRAPSLQSSNLVQTDHASRPAVIYKSNGCSIQPMIWNPDRMNRKREY